MHCDVHEQAAWDSLPKEQKRKHLSDIHYLVRTALERNAARMDKQRRKLQPPVELCPLQPVLLRAPNSKTYQEPAIIAVAYTNATYVQTVC
jgi:hypothetical protein